MVWKCPLHIYFRWSSRVKRGLTLEATKLETTKYDRIGWRCDHVYRLWRVSFQRQTCICGRVIDLLRLMTHLKKLVEQVEHEKLSPPSRSRSILTENFPCSTTKLQQRITSDVRQRQRGVLQSVIRWTRQSKIQHQFTSPRCSYSKASESVRRWSTRWAISCPNSPKDTRE
jgi:hypothetical protein